MKDIEQQTLDNCKQINYLITLSTRQLIGREDLINGVVEVMAFWRSEDKLTFIEQTSIQFSFLSEWWVIDLKVG